MDTRKLRAWWAHRQGLDGSLLGKSPSEILERSGWARSVGGVGPYLTLFSRGRISRKDADEAMARVEIHELPTARGCTYVVPARDFATGLTIGRDFSDEMKSALKLGVTEKEISALCTAVLRALAAGPLAPDGIRDATGSLSRSLGDAGKKKGLTTTLPLALGQLQTAGQIRRLPVNGRIDQQRYRYALWKPSPLEQYAGSQADAFHAVARHFFEWVGPATQPELQWFLGVGVKAAKEVIDSLPLVAAESGSPRLLLEEDADSFRAFTTPRAADYAVVSSLDAISATRRDMVTLLDAEDLTRNVVSNRTQLTIGGLTDLPSHAILDRGRIVGLWEYDPEREELVAATFIARDRKLSQALEETERFVRDELGDARSFSLDSPKSRQPRIDALRKMT